MFGVRLPQGSTFAGDIDGLILLILYFTGFGLWSRSWCFSLIFRFGAPGVKSQYITGEEKYQKKWVSYPLSVLVCDVSYCWARSGRLG